MPVSSKQKIEEPSIINDKEKEKTISKSLIVGEVSTIVEQIVKWINEGKKKLKQNPQHQGLLSLDFQYTDITRKTAVDAVLRLLGTRLLTEDERRDPQRPLSSGIQATIKPNIYIFYEHLRSSEKEPIQEKYTLLVALKMQLPTQIVTQKIQQVGASTGEAKPQPLTEEIPEEILEEEVQKAKEMKRAPGIFETINKVLLGEEEEE